MCFCISGKGRGGALYQKHGRRASVLFLGVFFPALWPIQNSAPTAAAGVVSPPSPRKILPDSQRDANHPSGSLACFRSPVTDSPPWSRHSERCAFTGSLGNVQSASSLASFRASGEQAAWTLPLRDLDLPAPRPGPGSPRVLMTRPSVANIPNWSVDWTSVPLRRPLQALARTARIPCHHGFQWVNNINPPCEQLILGQCVYLRAYGIYTVPSQTQTDRWTVQLF